jgi:phosphatidylcholine synthase
LPEAPSPHQRRETEAATGSIPPGGWHWLWSSAVHTFTASGIVCALMATLAALDGAYERCFAWLGLALLIDGIDGTFARLVGVKQRLPRFSGERLDLVVDYVTYVFVPVLALLKSGHLQGAWGMMQAFGILMSSLYHFSDEASKTDDNCFVGFPAIWNVVAFYLFAIPLPVWAASAVILVCIVTTFVPVRTLHPMRVRRLVWVNLAASAVWLMAAAYVVFTGFPASRIAAAALLAIAAYMILLTLTWPLAAAGKLDADE